MADTGRFYDVDTGRVSKMLDEFGRLNRLRRTVGHGWIRWHASNNRPILMDSQGDSVSAWPEDLADLNLKVLNWVQEYYAAQAALGRAVLHAYNSFADRLLQHPKVPPQLQALLHELKRKAEENLQPAT